MARATKEKVVVETTEIEEHNLTTDEIEDILFTHFYKKGYNIQFDWNVGQWVNLDVKISKVSTQTLA